MSITFKPVGDKAKVITSKIGHNFNHSENTVIKAVRSKFLFYKKKIYLDFGIATKTALNEGYQEGMGEKVQKAQLGKAS